MRRAAVLALLAGLALAGCSNPTFTLQFRVTDGLADACMKGSGEQAIQVTQCQDVRMSCAAVVNIRVFNPNTPTSPIINVCQELMMAQVPTLCEVAQVNLPQPTMPVDAQTLEVQIVVYPKNKLMLDDNHVPMCPATVEFGADGFPAPSLVPCLPDEPCEPTPAIGGSAFYHPGDSETVVELGCADLGLLNDPVCTGPSTPIKATVTDFDTLVSVPQSLAPLLTVGIGEPEVAGTPIHYALENAVTMTPTSDLTPTWTAMLTPPNLPCILIDEDVAGRTKSVRCTAPAPSQPPATTLVGTRLAKSSLDMILAALGLTGFPDVGLTVGIVLDVHGNPASGLAVTGTDSNGHASGTIKYLAANRQTVGGTVTAQGGIFLSEDAPFGTTFTASQADLTATAVGGLIDGKVTIVVLQLPNQTGQ
ncbi:MAG TPA: hypothetical protein VIV58_05975 [Kofleriaceae bacterium]